MNRRTLGLTFLAAWVAVTLIRAQAPAPKNAIERLQQSIDRGDVTLKFEDEFGYLRSVLAALDIPVSSQSLVFSRTSLAREYISPIVPRAIYFRDDTYVAFVRNGIPLEVATIGADQKPTFYALDQQVTARPQFTTDATCLICHDPRRTGTSHLIMRSHFTDRQGNAFQSTQAPGLIVDSNDRTPFAQRWGGWYVTGTHGSQQHLGNIFAPTVVTSIPESQLEGYAAKMDRSKGANVTDLGRLIDTSFYITPHSDIVALTVLGHQVAIQNLVADAAAARTDDEVRKLGEPLLRALLFYREAPLTDSVKGTSGFAEQFQAVGPRDRLGRSLRDFDLTRRTFRYPLSYPIYSDAFNQLPMAVRNYVYSRLRQVLTGTDQSAEFSDLSALDRQAVLEILRDTKPEFAP